VKAKVTAEINSVLMAQHMYWRATLV